VARKVGYTSEFAFAHAFKREYGSAPGVFRRSAIDPSTDPHSPRKPSPRKCEPRHTDT
jgi:AraC-like DNA-binding protein